MYYGFKKADEGLKYILASEIILFVTAFVDLVIGYFGINITIDGFSRIMWFIAFFAIIIETVGVKVATKDIQKYNNLFYAFVVLVAFNICDYILLTLYNNGIATDLYLSIYSFNWIIYI